MAAVEELARLGLYIDSSGVVRADQAMARLRRTGARTERTMKSQLGTVSKMVAKYLALTVVIAKAVQIVTKSVTVYAKFQRQMQMVSTMLDRTALGTARYNKQMEQFTVGIERLSVRMGEGTQTLTKGLYDILSASVPASKAMYVLEVSAKAAKAGLTDTATSVDFITSALNAFQLSADQARKVADIAFATVARGKTTFGELAQNIGQVAPTAAITQFGLEKLGAAIATVTRQGMNTAEATTAINSMLTSFIQKTPKAVAAWNELRKGTELAGEEFGVALLQGEKWVKFLKVMEKANSTQVFQVASNIRGFRGLAAILKDVKGHFEDLKRTQNAAGEAQRAYQKIAKGIQEEMNKASAAIDNLWRAIGRAFGESAIKLIRSFTEQVNRFADAVNRMTGATENQRSPKGALDYYRRFTEDSDPGKWAKFKGFVYKHEAPLWREQGMADPKNMSELINRAMHLSERYLEMADITKEGKKLDAVMRQVAMDKHLWLEEEIKYWTGIQKAYEKKVGITTPMAGTVKTKGLAYPVGPGLPGLMSAKEMTDWNKMQKSMKASGLDQFEIQMKKAEQLYKKQYDKIEGYNDKAVLSHTQYLKAKEANEKQYSDTQKKILDSRLKYYKEIVRGKTELNAQYDLEMAKYTKDKLLEVEAQHKLFVINWLRRGKTLAEAEKLWAARRVYENRSAFQRMLEDWSDVNKHMTKITEQSLSAIRDMFASFFQEIFETGKFNWDKLWKAFVSIASNALAQTLVTYGQSFLAGLLEGGAKTAAGGTAKGASGNLIGSALTKVGGLIADKIGLGSGGTAAGGGIDLAALGYPTSVIEAFGGGSLGEATALGGLGLGGFSGGGGVATGGFAGGGSGLTASLVTSIGIGAPLAFAAGALSFAIAAMNKPPEYYQDQIAKTTEALKGLVDSGLNTANESIQKFINYMHNAADNANMTQEQIQELIESLGPLGKLWDEQTKSLNKVDEALGRVHSGYVEMATQGLEPTVEDMANFGRVASELTSGNYDLTKLGNAADWATKEFTKLAEELGIGTGKLDFWLQKIQQTSSMEELTSVLVKMRNEWRDLSNAIVAGANDAIPKIETVGDAINNLPSVKNIQINIAQQGSIPSFGTGGIMAESGLAYLHAGEVVLNNVQVSNLGGSQAASAIAGGARINYGPTVNVYGSDGGTETASLVDDVLRHDKTRLKRLINRTPDPMLV